VIWIAVVVSQIHYLSIYLGASFDIGKIFVLSCVESNLFAACSCEPNYHYSILVNLCTIELGFAARISDLTNNTASVAT